MFDDIDWPLSKRVARFVSDSWVSCLGCIECYYFISFLFSFTMVWTIGLIQIRDWLIDWLSAATWTSSKWVKREDPCWAPVADGGLSRVSISVFSGSIGGLHTSLQSLVSINSAEYLRRHVIGAWHRMTESGSASKAGVTTLIRLRFDGHSTASLAADPLDAVTLTCLFIRSSRQQHTHRPAYGRNVGRRMVVARSHWELNGGWIEVE